MIKHKQSFILIFALVLIFVLSGCGTEKNGSSNGGELSPSPSPLEPSPKELSNKELYSKETNPVATIEMENGDQIQIELYPEIAPNTVENFISLANSGFYDGVIFHRVMAGFMIQGGDPMGNGAGGPGYAIKGEFAINGFDNPIKHTRGVISMGRRGNPAYDTAGSQFFIVHKDSSHLDGEYAAFGEVVEGIEGVDNIAEIETVNDRPTVEQKIKTVTVDTKGVNYEAPEVIK